MADARHPDFDPRANRSAAVLAILPAVFLLHFSAVYGANALACRFGGSGSWADWPRVPLVVGGLTLLALLVVGWAARSAPGGATEGATEREYDFAARRAFVGKTTVMLAWLVAAGVLAVASTVLLAQPCA